MKTLLADMMHGRAAACVLLVAVAMTSCAAIAAGDGVPFSAIRLRKPQTDSAKVWQATLAQFAKYRAGIDEVWFSTGISFPKMDEHRANAASPPPSPTTSAAKSSRRRSTRTASPTPTTTTGTSRSTSTNPATS